ncbi:MAG TPA: hypothetical protein PLA46_01330 [Phycicoccus sp.]|nr:hypothetical protein [Phycicoccus sp.]
MSQPPSPYPPPSPTPDDGTAPFPPPPPTGYAGPSPVGYPPPANPGPGGPPSATNTKAVVGLVCGILGILFAFCCSLLGVPLGLVATVMGVLAKQEIAASGGREAQSAGMAQAAFVTGIIAMVLAVGMVVLGLISNLGLGATQWLGLKG